MVTENPNQKLHPPKAALIMAGTMATCDEKGALEIKKGICLRVRDGYIEEVSKDLQPRDDEQVIDAKNQFITPSFCDPHTHLWPENRSKEFAMRAAGKSYQEIAAAGGGIINSMKQFRQMTAEEIIAFNRKILERFWRKGTTLLELKSGYGLDLPSEIKALRVIKTLADEFQGKIKIIPTFLGAHAIPPEFSGDGDGYIEHICQRMIPQIAKARLAVYCDVFCEKELGFSPQQAEKIILCAKNHGLGVRIHADEFQDSGAAAIAGRHQVNSADHLAAISEEGIAALIEGGVFAIACPATMLALGQSEHAPLDKIIASGGRFALASDYNPGSNPSYQSMSLIWRLGVTHNKLSVEQGFAAVTVFAAQSLGEHHRGFIAPGTVADLLFWNDVKELEDIPYRLLEESLVGIMNNGILRNVSSC